MSATRRVMKNWALFGLGLGALSTIDLFIASGGNLVGSLAGLAVGAVAGVSGFVLRLLLPSDRKFYVPTLNGRAKLMTAISVILIAVASIVRISGGPFGAYMGLVAISIALSGVTWYARKQHR